MSESNIMPRWQRVYFAASAWVIGFAGAYCAAQWGEWPKLTYFPLARKWEFWEMPPSPLPMPYIGLVLWGVGGGLVAAAMIWIVSGRISKRSDREIRLVSAWTLSAFAFSGLFYTWNLWPF